MQGCAAARQELVSGPAAQPNAAVAAACNHSLTPSEPGLWAKAEGITEQKQAALLLQPNCAASWVHSRG